MSSSNVVLFLDIFSNGKATKNTLRYTKLPDIPIVIGSGASASIKIPSLDSTHAIIKWDNNKLYIENYSHNAILVGESTVDCRDSCQLRHGDIVTLSPTHQLRVNWSSSKTLQTTPSMNAATNPVVNSLANSNSNLAPPLQPSSNSFSQAQIQAVQALLQQQAQPQPPPPQPMQFNVQNLMQLLSSLGPNTMGSNIPVTWANVNNQ